MTKKKIKLIGGPRDGEIIEVERDALEKWTADPAKEERQLRGEYVSSDFREPHFTIGYIIKGKEGHYVERDSWEWKLRVEEWKIKKEQEEFWAKAIARE